MSNLTVQPKSMFYFRKMLSSLCILFCLTATNAALAADPVPVTMLKETTVNMLAFLKSHRGSLKSQPQLLEGEVRRVVVPKFDLTSMAQSVVGRRHWTSSSPAERQAFIHEFTDLVVSVYAAPLADYSGDSVEFHPLRGGVAGQARIVVRTTIIRSNGQRIQVNYSLKSAGSSWRVYDFSIEGISMVASYRSQFADVLENKGMSGLLAQMRVHNRNS